MLIGSRAPGGRRPLRLMGAHPRTRHGLPGTWGAGTRRYADSPGVAVPATHRSPPPGADPRDEHVAARTTTHRGCSQAARPRRHLHGRSRAAHLRHHRLRVPNPGVQGPHEIGVHRPSTASGSSCSWSPPGSSSRSSRRWAGPSPTGGARELGGGPVVRKASARAPCSRSASWPSRSSGSSPSGSPTGCSTARRCCWSAS